MYQYSLQFYQQIFILRLENKTKSEILEERLDFLLKDITLSIFVNICRGLFEKDKIIFAFMIAIKILLQKNAITWNEWKFFLVGDSGSGSGSVGNGNNNTSALTSNSTTTITIAKKPEWLSERIWRNILVLENVSPAFEGLVESVCNSNNNNNNNNNSDSRNVHGENRWKLAMVKSMLPHNEPLPDGWQTRLNPFQKLLILRAFREEMLVFGIKEFVGKELGTFFMESPPFDLNGCFQDSKPETPLIFVLSPGADINDYLLELAKQEGKDGNGLKIISLGQGQGPIAEALMKQAKQNGDWVCLQNCHLAISWLGRLEQILEQTQAQEIHRDFRLWLTSMPSERFPIPILQNGIKITNEPPKGIKANLGRTFLDMKENDYENCSKPKEFKKLIFALSFYNAVCLERRKFGAVGWNIPYEWMNSDLKTGMQQVKLYLEEQETVPYVTLNVMVADISYGGRITDRWDKRTNSSIMRKLFCPQVMDDNYRFTSSDSYYAPPEGSLQSVRDYVSQLPTVDTPEIFGLHSNADITFQQKETSQLIETILKMGGAENAESNSSSNDENENNTPVKSNDSIVMDLVLAIQERMPDFFSENKAHPLTFQEIGGSRNSLGVFLSQEMIRFNALIKVMKVTLEQLKRAIKGLVVMSGPLEKMYNGFLIQKIPKEWEDAGYPCLKPLGSWIEDFFARISFTQQWIENGPPTCFWLSGFFFPQGFMTAVKQTYSRDKKIAIDALVLSCEFLTMDKESYTSSLPSYGVYIYGLFMEGARFDRTIMMMAESIPNELFDRMPVIWLKPMRRDEYEPSNVYECPLYKTSIRAGTLSTTGHSTNFVVTLDVPTDKDPDHWIRRGTAMLCMLDT
jgi:dynein heavy chain